MYKRSPKYVLVLLTLVLVPATGCGTTDDAEGQLTGPTAAMSRALVTAEPEVVTPAVVGHRSCTVGSPFGFRVGLTVTGRRGLFLRGVRFALFDPFGHRTLPVAVSALGASHFGASPSAGPVPVPGALTMPSSSPIPIPGGTRTTFPFFLEFGCGAPSAGTLVATVHVLDENGSEETTEVRIRVGR